MSLLKILHLEINWFLAVFVLILFLPFSSNQKTRYYGCYIVYIFLLLLGAVFLIILFLFRPRDVRNSAIAGQFYKHITKLVGIQWELRGGDILEVQRGAVIVANHQSMFDILGALGICRTMGRCVMVGKKELFYFWPFGIAAWLAGTVFVDRGRARVAHEQLDEASHLVKNQQTKLWIFPEGTRNSNPDSMLPFKKGAFRVAVSCQVPIIPVVYSPYYFIDHGNKYFGRGRVVIRCLEPVSTEGKTVKDIDWLIEEVRGKMAKEYEVLKQEVLNTNR